MRTRRSKPAHARLPRDAERLVTPAHALGASGSRIEDTFWERRLMPEVARLLDAGADQAIDAALDALHPVLPAYEALIEVVETLSESIDLEHEGVQYQALLVAAPILAWSKYAIPSGPLRADTAAAMLTQLQAHVAAATTRVALAPILYSLDQLPQGFSGLRSMTRTLALQALQGKPAPAVAAALPDTVALLADSRYLLAAFVAPQGEALFQWQEFSAKDSTGKPMQNRDQTLARWREQGQPNLTNAMSGCVLELLLPDGFHVSCREADRLIRPYSVPAALALIENIMQTEAAQLRAVIAPFGTEGVEEFRIGLTKKNSQDVVHGIIWPLYGTEQGPEPDGPMEQIDALLRKSGLTDILILNELFPMEFCDDCGAPLYADPQADLVHAEFPEETEGKPRTHLH